MSSLSPVPSDVARVFSKFIAAEFAYFTPKGAPLCWPVTPYWYPDRQQLAIATGLAYPKKADYPKLNPRVALYFSDATASGIDKDIRVLVQGQARVQDEDLQANTDRYVRELREKFPVARFGLNPVTVKLLDFYLPRLWVDITPLRVTIERAGEPADVIEMGDEAELPDVGIPVVIGPPAPPGSRAKLGDADAKALATQIRRFGEGVVTTRGRDGFPAMFRTELVHEVDGSISIPEVENPGPACITMHHHRLRGTHFQAYMVRGHVPPTSPGTFVPERLVGFFGNGTVFPLSVLPQVGMLRKRLREELDRRDADMPALRIP